MHENNGKPEALLWIDFETTGVDRRKSLPLKIGMECTDMLGEQKFGSLSRIIRPDRLDLLSMSPVVFSMHTDNGLLFELMGGSVRNDSMATIRQLVTVLGAPDPYQGDSGPHRVKSCIARDIKDYKAMLETLAVKTGDHK